MKNIFLLGKPNSGKSSLFNKLTGLNQKIGNYAGVTVEIKSGRYKRNSENAFQIVDIPGLQSLDATSAEEYISKEQILKIDPQTEAIVFIANGMQLKDSLILFSQIADLQLPMILAINFKDEMTENKIQLNLEKLEKRLACPIVLMNARSGEGLDTLDGLIQNNQFVVPTSFSRSLHDEFQQEAYHNDYRKHVAAESPFDFWEEEYNNRSKIVENIVEDCVDTQKASNHLNSTQKWDKILLHPIWGLLIFIGVLFLLFQSVFSLSVYPMDWIDASFSALGNFCKEQIPIGWLSELIGDALIPGIGGVVIFIPQIAILFFLLGILEQSGYLARISYISDAFLRKFGLSGHSVIPLMSSWACAIPAIMSARVISDPKERLTVILASPLMTCSARLPVYTILIAVMFPADSGAFWGAKGLALLLLYLLGVVATLVVSWVINRNMKVDSNAHWMLELPVFRWPNWQNIFITVYQKTKSFVVQAGKIILGISILLWLLASQSPHNDSFIDEQFQTYQQTTTDQSQLSKESVELEYSYLGYLGKIVEPAIKPLGYDWKIGIALLSSFAAREVFVGTISTIYSIGSEEESTIVERLRSEKVASTGEARYSWATSISLLLFYVFALQCMSTLAIVRKETGSWKYAMFQFFLMLALAYGFALMGYWVFR